MDLSLRERYDAVPYRHGAISTTHPARLGLIGRLLGLATAAPERCRVLELGCGEGMNLLPMAERLPHGEFVGVDFSAAQIGMGEEARSFCEIHNVRLECADLREFEVEPESYDYVIAHGVYSWVPDDVKERLLAICGRSLAPGGVAYLSYNTLPGWGLLTGLRAFLRDEASLEVEPQAQLRHIGEVLQVLGDSLADQPGAYAVLMRDAVRDMAAKPPALLFHDELAAVNDPCTFTHFTRHAEQHGLRYFAEARYSETAAEHMPLQTRNALQRLSLEPLRVQQFMDVLYQRWLRGSILCRADAPAAGELVLDAIRGSVAALRMRVLETRVDLRPGVPFRLASKAGRELSFDAPLEKAFLATLAQAAPAPVSYARARATADKLVAQANLAPGANDEQLCSMLHELFLVDGVDLLLAGDGSWLQTRQAGAPSPLMRYQAAHALPLANRWHEAITLTGRGAQALIEATGAQPEPVLAQAGLLV